MNVWGVFGIIQGMKKFDFSLCDSNQERLNAYRPLPPETLKSLRDYYRIGLTYSSNAIEGNSLTESETKVVIEDGLTVEGKPLRDVCEAVGHAKAYDHIYDLMNEISLKEGDILSLHRMFYEQIDSKNAGCYRDVQVFISGSHYRLPLQSQVPTLMKQFVSWYNETEGTLHPIEFAALVHQKFVFIHPFIDGNGRLARLLMNLALLRAGWSISIIPPILRHEYISSLEKAHEDIYPFIEFIKGRVIETQRELLRLFGDEIAKKDTSGGVNSLDGGVNLLSGGVNDNRTKVLVAINQLAGINTPALSKQLNIPLRTVQRIIKTLTNEKKIEFRGAPKNGGYFIVAGGNNPVEN